MGHAKEAQLGANKTGLERVALVLEGERDSFPLRTTSRKNVTEEEDDSHLRSEFLFRGNQGQ